MNIQRITSDVSSTTNINLLHETSLPGLKSFSLSVCLVVIGISLGATSLSVRAEIAGTKDAHPNYRYIKPVAVEHKAGNVSQGTIETPALADEKTKIEPIAIPTDGKGTLPLFAQADIDGDHYITKVELKNYPYLLQVFDKVDAGEDGKLEQHEYQNLKMETKREGEVR